MKLTGTNSSIGLIALIYQCPSPNREMAACSQKAPAVLEERKTAYARKAPSGFRIKRMHKDRKSFASKCVSPAWWPSAKRSDPIPSRTRPSNASAPMVLCLKTWESRSSPGLPNTSILSTDHTSKAPLPHKRRFSFDAGWSSPVARQAHNLKVAGSNPAPASRILRQNRALLPRSQAVIAERKATMRSIP